MIPKIFHQIWLNGDMPDPHKYFTEHMLELHPGWEYKFWTERNKPKLFNEEAYQTFSKPAFKADILRYEILLKYGGVYVDTDYLFLKNIEPCLTSNIFLIEEFEEPSKQLITNCLMGSSPNHYFMQYLVMKIPEMMIKYEEMCKEGIGKHAAGLKTVGPIYLDNCAKEIFGYRPSYPTKFFCPFRQKETKEAQLREFPEAYGMHLWNYNQGPECLKVHETLPIFKRYNKII
jgi:mannosyltransferase OCH1-like enzyme